MKIILEVPDEDAARVLEALKDFDRVEVKSTRKIASKASRRLAADLQEAGRELALIKQGKEVGRPAHELLAELKSGL